MKVKCISNEMCGNTLKLTIGQVYDTYCESADCYSLINNAGDEAMYSTCLFEIVNDTNETNNKMEEIAKLLGVELDEEFEIEGSAVPPYKITIDQGLINRDGDKRLQLLNDLILGVRKIIKKPWIPKMDEMYYHVDVFRDDVLQSIWENDILDNNRLQYNIITKTEKEANIKLKKLKKLLEVHIDEY